MSTNAIAITTSSFAKMDRSRLNILTENGFEAKFNDTGKVLTEEGVKNLLKGCRGVIAGTEIYNSEILESLDRLKVISRVGSGLDSIDLKRCEDLNIKVYAVSDGPVKAVAELVIGLMLNLLRNVSLMDRNLRNGVWKKEMGALLSEKQIGIIGMGKIGQEVARLASAIGSKVSFSDPVVKSWEGCEKKVFIELLETADIISLHVPLKEENHHLIGSKEFDIMKNSAYLINCSRGGIVDENALYEALKDKKIAGAAIDVFEDEPYQGPLTQLDHCLLTPHIGSYAKEARIKMEIDAVKNLIQGLGRKI